MELELDPGSPVPLYRQIAEGVKRLIALGVVRPGERLPTVRELAVRSRVNRNTAARAIRELELLGLVRTRVGQGTFVQDDGGRIDLTAGRQALERALDGVIVEAQSLGVDLEELPLALDRRIEAFRDRRRAGAVEDER